MKVLFSTISWRLVHYLIRRKFHGTDENFLVTFYSMYVGWLEYKDSISMINREWAEQNGHRWRRFWSPWRTQMKRQGSEGSWTNSSKESLELLMENLFLGCLECTTRARNGWQEQVCRQIRNCWKEQLLGTMWRGRWDPSNHTNRQVQTESYQSCHRTA